MCYLNVQCIRIVSAIRPIASRWKQRIVEHWSRRKFVELERSSLDASFLSHLVNGLQLTGVPEDDASKIVCRGANPSVSRYRSTQSSSETVTKQCR